MDKNKKYLDLEGLSLYDTLTKERTDKSISDSLDPIVTEINSVENSVKELGVCGEVEGTVTLTGGVVKNYVDKQLESVSKVSSEAKGLYYRRENGDFVYKYQEATGTAVTGTVYYERTGQGTTADPYLYVEKQVTEGTSVEGLYVRVGRYTTINPSEEELNYPVLDEEGNQKTEVVSVVDTSTQSAIISIMKDYTTISDTEILDLFVEEQ